MRRRAVPYVPLPPIGLFTHPDVASDHVAVSMCPSTGVVPLSRVARVGSSVTFSRAQVRGAIRDLSAPVCLCTRPDAAPPGRVGCPVRF